MTAGNYLRDHPRCQGSSSDSTAHWLGELGRVSSSSGASVFSSVKWGDDSTSHRPVVKLKLVNKSITLKV